MSSDQTQHLKSCPYLSQCSGCHFEHLPYKDQVVHKKQHLTELLKTRQISAPEINFRTIAENKLRHRFDFTINNGKMGLYDFDKKILDVAHCLQISDELQKAYDDLRKISFPIKKGSVRLRIGPENQRGVWLDFANVDIKNLLDEKTTLEQLKIGGFKVEIGQKGKSLISVNGSFKLGNPEIEPWFKTKLENNNYVTLNCLVSSFTQPSWETAFVMTDLVREWIAAVKPSRQARVAEFGAGVGQFTLPLLAHGYSVDVYEYHEQATKFLKLNAKTHQLDKNLRVFCGDFQKNSLADDLKYDFAFVNPPRSGLKGFARELVRLKVNYCVYVSCFPESLTEDLEIFLQGGYLVNEITIVDQFPQTKHYETCVLLQRVDLNA